MPVEKIMLGEETFFFTYTYKKVKNINLRITSDGEVHISLPKQVSRERLFSFLQEKENWIKENRRKILARQRMIESAFEQRTPLWEEAVFSEILDEVYLEMKPYLKEKPVYVVRDMKTRWGSCTPSRGKITLNRKLLYAPRVCIIYVVTHELIHFIHPDHSKRFYAFFDLVMPRHREYKKLLEAQNIL